MSRSMEIPLLNSSEVAVIDASDFSKVCGYVWTLHVSSKYAKYASAAVEGGQLLMHRLLLDAPKGLCVDHINRDRLDNRRANLRMATRSQIGARKTVSRVCSTGVKGVYFEPGRTGAQKYRATVGYCGTRTRKRFSTVAEAQAWLESTRAKVLGEFST